MARRALLLVADSAGCGAMPDADRYGDEGSDTIGNTSRAVGGLRAAGARRPRARPPHRHRGRAARPGAAGALRQARRALAGQGHHHRPLGDDGAGPLRALPHLPAAASRRRSSTPFLAASGAPGVLGNEVASGTEIIARLGAEHERTGWPIVYTSADSVFQIAAHEAVVPLERLYGWCEAARRVLDPLAGGAGHRPAVRGPARRLPADLPPARLQPEAAPGPTVLERLREAGPARWWGWARSATSSTTAASTRRSTPRGTPTASPRPRRSSTGWRRGLVFVNLVDFDMLYGHRNDPAGYARALEALDAFLPRLLAKLGPDDLLVVTADHGCDPTTPSTDHSREHVPLLVHAPGRPGGAARRARRPRRRGGHGGRLARRGGAGGAQRPGGLGAVSEAGGPAGRPGPGAAAVPPGGAAAAPEPRPRDRPRHRRDRPAAPAAASARPSRRSASTPATRRRRRAPTPLHRVLWGAGHCPARRPAWWLPTAPCAAPPSCRRLLTVVGCVLLAGVATVIADPDDREAAGAFHRFLHRLRGARLHAAHHPAAALGAGGPAGAAGPRAARRARTRPPAWASCGSGGARG